MSVSGLSMETALPGERNHNLPRSSPTPSAAPSARRTSPSPADSRKSANFNDEEPAFNAKMMASESSVDAVSGVGPDKVAHLGHVLHVLGDVSSVTLESVGAFSHEGIAPGDRLARALQSFDRQVEPTDLVEHHHVERRRRGPFLAVAAHVEPMCLFTAVQKLMDGSRIAVKREDDVHLRREQIVESLVVHSVRMLEGRSERHQIDDIDQPHCQLGSVLSQPCCGGNRLERRNIAGTSEHDVGFTFPLGAGPLPNGGAASAVLLGRAHVEPLQLRLFESGPEPKGKVNPTSCS